MKLFLTLFALVCWSGCLSAESYIVAVPIADVMEARLEGRCKKVLLNGRNSHLCIRDVDGLDTQLLAGEIVDVVRECGDGFVVVDIPGQQYFDKDLEMWSPMRGLVWQEDLRKVVPGELREPTHILCDDILLQRDSGVSVMLSMGTRVCVEAAGDGSENMQISCALGVFAGYVPSTALRQLKKYSFAAEIRNDIVMFALKFLGTPYRFSGTSGYDASEEYHVTGIDCSGLPFLAYRSVGIELPRTSHDQWLKSTVVPGGKDLLPGDCVFLGEQPRESSAVRVRHVMLVKDCDTLIEMTSSLKGSVNKMDAAELKLAGCHEIKPEEHPVLQRPLHEIVNEQEINGRVVYLGRFVPEGLD